MPSDTTLRGTLGTGLSNTTNIAPASLGTTNPFPTPFVDNKTVSSTWTTQTATYCKALFPLGVKDGQGYVPLKLHLKASSAGATVTVTIWQYNRTSATWYSLESAYSVKSGADAQVYEYDIVGLDPIWIQLGTPSAGTFSIYFNSEAFVAA